MLDTFPSPLLRTPNHSELFFELKNGSKLFFKSGQVLEDLRIETLNGVVIDEVRQQHPELWPRVIRPMLASTKGWADFLSTPNGHDHFFDLFQDAQTNQQEWSTFHVPCNEVPWWTEDEIVSARRTMSEPEFAQEILAEFRDLTHGKAYIAHGSDNQATTSPFAVDTVLSPFLPIVVACDFNVTPIAWTLGQQRIDQFYFHDEIWLTNSHTQEAAQELVERVKGHKPGVIIIGDATGKATKTSAAGQTDYTILGRILDEAKIKWVNKTPDSNPLVKDRVNSVNAALKDAHGNTRLWYHPTQCPHLKRDFDRVVWKPGAQAILDQTTDPMLTHSSDGVGYAVCALTPIQSTEVGTLRVIRR